MQVGAEGALGLVLQVQCERHTVTTQAALAVGVQLLKGGGLEEESVCVGVCCQVEVV